MQEWAHGVPQDLAHACRRDVLIAPQPPRTCTASWNMSMLSVCAATRMMGRPSSPPAAPGAGGGGSSGTAAHTLQPPRGLQLPAARHALLLAALSADMGSLRRAWYRGCLGSCNVHWRAAAAAAAPPPPPHALPCAAIAPCCAGRLLEAQRGAQTHRHTAHPACVVQRALGRLRCHLQRQQEGGCWQPGERQRCCGSAGCHCCCVPGVGLLRIGRILCSREGCQCGVVTGRLCVWRGDTPGCCTVSAWEAPQSVPRNLPAAAAVAK
jgi:hypothetical protein